MQHRGPESCKTKLTCNILPLDVARQSPRATYCPRMLQDEAHVQHIAPGCCKRMSTCNIAPPKVAREDRRATYCLRKLQEKAHVQHRALLIPRFLNKSELSSFYIQKNSQNSYYLKNFGCFYNAFPIPFGLSLINLLSKAQFVNFISYISRSLHE